MHRVWTTDEIRALWETAYRPVLRAEIRGLSVNKAEYLRRAESVLAGRTFHICKDRCYRISTLLRDEGLPFVAGWRPPDEVGQSPNSAGQTAVIRSALFASAREEFG